MTHIRVTIKNVGDPFFRDTVYRQKIRYKSNDRGDVLLILQRCLTIVKLIMSVTAMIMTAASAASGM